MAEPDRRIKLSLGMWVNTKLKLAYEARRAWPLECLIYMTEEEQDKMDHECQVRAQNFMEQHYVLDFGLLTAKAKGIVPHDHGVVLGRGGTKRHSTHKRRNRKNKKRK